MPVQTQIYLAEHLRALDPCRIPHHIAFIPDGNRRWAKKNRQTIAQGHRKGADVLMDVVKAAKELGVRVVTSYVFSTENWNREQEEVHSFLGLLETYLEEQRQTMLDHGIRLQSIGDVSRFPESIKKTLQETKDATSHCSDIDLVFAMNYGGRDEIRRAVQSILADHTQMNFKKDDVTETLITRYLDTSRWKDPDLLIRTSGERRLSNFLLWQASYAEVYITDVLWPDFTPQHLLEAIFNFQGRERRLGGT